MVVSLERIAGKKKFRVWDNNMQKFVDESVVPVRVDGKVVLVSDPELVAKYEAVNVVGATPSGIVYHDRVGADGVARDIVLFDEPFQDGRRFTHGQLWEASRSADPGEPRGLNSVDTYQALRLNLAERRNKAYGFIDGRVAAVQTLFDRSFPRSTTETVFKPLGEESIVRHLNLNGTVTEHELEIPEGIKRYNNFWSFLVLAPEQNPRRLGRVRKIPGELRPTVEAYLGEGYEEAGAVYQFHNSRLPNGNLREARLWLPTAQNRGFTGSFGGGVYVVGGFGFGLGPNGNVGTDRPAFAGAQKISTGNEGYVQRAK